MNALLAVAVVALVVVVVAVAAAMARRRSPPQAPRAVYADAPQAQQAQQVKTLIGLLTSGFNDLFHLLGSVPLPAGSPVGGTLNALDLGDLVQGDGSYVYGWSVFSVDIYYNYIVNAVYGLAGFSFSNVNVTLGDVNADGTQLVKLRLRAQAPQLNVNVDVNAWAGSPIIGGASVQGACKGVALTLNDVTVDAAVGVMLAGCGSWPPRVTAISVDSLALNFGSATTSCDISLDLTVLGFTGVLFNISKANLGPVMAGTLRSFMPTLAQVLGDLMNINCALMKVPIPFPCVQVPPTGVCLPGVTVPAAQPVFTQTALLGVTQVECKAICEQYGGCNYAYMSGDPSNGSCLLYHSGSQQVAGYGSVWSKATGKTTTNAMLMNSSYVPTAQPLPLSPLSCARVCGNTPGCAGYSVTGTGCQLIGNGVQQLTLDFKHCDRSVTAPATFQ